jgi:hypothetical protein
MYLNETYSEVHIGEYMSDSLTIQNGLKEGNAKSSLLFNCATEYTIKWVKGNQVGLKLNGTCGLLAYAYDVNLLGDTSDTRFFIAQ